MYVCKYRKNAEMHQLVPVVDIAGNEHIRCSTSEVEKVRRVTSGTNLNTITRRDTSHVELVSDIAVGVDMMRGGASMNCVQGENDETGDLGFDGPAFDDVGDDRNDAYHPVCPFLDE